METLNIIMILGLFVIVVIPTVVVLVCEVFEFISNDFDKRVKK